MNSTNIVFICQEPKLFSESEVNSLIPLLEKITSRHENIVTKLINQQQFLIKSGASEKSCNKLQDEVNMNMVQWGSKLTKLGGKVFDHGFVGFDGGGFYYSWHYGEKTISQYHLYNESPFNRKPIKVEVS